MRQMTPFGMLKAVVARSSHSNSEPKSRLLILYIPLLTRSICPFVQKYASIREGIPASLPSAEEKTTFLDSALSAAEYLDLIILMM